MQTPSKKCDPMRQGLLNNGALELVLSKQIRFYMDSTEHRPET